MSDPVPLTSSQTGPDTRAPAPGGSPHRFQGVPLLQAWGAPARFIKSLIDLLRIPPPTTPQLLERIETMERDIVLPIKVAGIAMLLQSFPWIRDASGVLDIPVEYARYFLWVYISINIAMAGLLFL